MTSENESKSSSEDSRSTVGSRNDECADDLNAGFDKNSTKLTSARRRRTWGHLIRWALYFFLLILVLMGFGVAATKAWLQPHIVSDILKREVAEAIGSRLEIDSLKFDLFHKIEVSGIRVYAPQRGLISIAPTDYSEDPFFSCDKFEARFNLIELLVGQLNIRSFRFIRPYLNITIDPGGTSLDGILHFHDLMKPKKKSKSLEVEKQDEGSMLSILSHEGLLDPSTIFMPFNIFIQNVGFQDSRIQLLNRAHSTHQTIETNIHGLDFNLAATWNGNQSDIWVSIGSGYETLLQFKQFRHVKNSPNKNVYKPISSIDLSALSRLHIKNMENINFDFAARQTHGQTRGMPHINVPIVAGARIKVDYNYLRIGFEKVFVTLPGAIAWELQGLLGLPKSGNTQVFVDLDQKIDINIQPLLDIASFFVDGIEGVGRIKTDYIKINGNLDLKNLNTNGFAAGKLPQLNGAFSIEDLSVVFKEPNFRIRDLSGTFKFGSIPDENMKNMFLETSFNVHAEQLLATQRLNAHDIIKAKFDEAAVQFESKLSLSDGVLKIRRSTLKSRKFSISGQDIPGWEAPLLIELWANGDKNDSRLSVAADFNWDRILQASFQGECSMNCKKFHVISQAKLVSLRSIYAGGGPFVAGLIPKLFRPTVIKGALAAKAEVSGELRSASSTGVAEVWRNGSLRFDSEINLKQAHFEVPFQNLSVDDLSVKLASAGDLKHQSAGLYINFGKAQMSRDKKRNSTPGSNEPVADGSVTFEKASTVFKFSNSSLNIDEVSEFFRKSISDISGRVVLGSSRGLDDLVALLAGSQIEFRAKQIGLNSFDLQKFEINVPALGVSANINGKTALDDMFVPLSINLTCDLDVSTTKQENISSNLKSSGSLRANFGVRSADMSQFLIQGLADFEDFSIEGILDPSNPRGILKLTGMSGRVPIAQIVDFPKLLSKGWTHSGSSGGHSPEEKLRMPKISDESTAPSSETILSKKIRNSLKSQKENQEEKSSAAPRIDYSSMRGFYPNKKPIFIKNILAADIDFSDISLDFDVRQGLLAINEFSMKTLGGRIHGDFQADFDLSNQPPIGGIKKPVDILKKVRSNMQLTRLDTRRLLDRVPGVKHFSSIKNGNVFFSDPFIDATMRVQWETETSDLSGSVDITSIGKDQMHMIFMFVDPSENNPTIVDMRRALSVGEIRRVSVPIRNGEIGMEIDVRALGVPIPTPELTRFPISQIINNIKRSRTNSDNRKGFQS